MQISQAKLAESAGLSVPHLVGIEYCKTWVSDKTLSSIANALNLEAHELLTPEKSKKNTTKNKALQRIAGTVKAKKTLMRQKTGEMLDDLMLEIIKNYEKD